MKNVLLFVASTVWLVAVSGTMIAQDVKSARTSQQPTDRMEWFREAKFGMFIHWGVYAVPAGEWKDRTDLAEWFQLQSNMPTAEYAKYIDQFDPVNFDAKAWVKVAKVAGMKYMVITAKHHDGFCMWPTKLSDWSICRTPWWQRTQRDLLKELSVACHDAGLVFCLYYSLPDWNHPEFPARYSQTNTKGNPNAFHGDPKPDADIDEYVAYMKGQLQELLTNYGPIGIIWFDGGGSFKGPDVDRSKLLHAPEVVELIHSLQPDCLVNNRLDDTLGDYGTPEQKIPNSKLSTAFEVCMTLNKHWGFNKADQNWKESAEVIDKLADIASKGGNFLLNVGPTAMGEFPPDSIRILGEVGSWLRVNGDAIYGTTAGPFKNLPWGYCTEKASDSGSTLFLCVTDWPHNGSLFLPGLQSKVTKVSLLSQPKELDFKQSQAGVTFDLPKEAPNKVPSVVCIEIEDLVARISGEEAK